MQALPEPPDVPPSRAAASPADAGSRRARETLDAALARAGASPDDIWVFGYASLIWRPEFDAVETQPARLLGWHRCLRMRSRINRGTPELPGLVFCLLNGGTCKGVAFRVSPRSWRDDLARLWDREMFTGVYEPRWLACRTPHGTVRALAFTLERLHPNHTGPIADDAMLDILRHARGRYGTTLEYLLDTARGLREHGIRDREIERLVALAVHAGLVKSAAPMHAGLATSAAPVHL
jgi:glutathione-specific gamma-glutamylcyclotransferase